MKKKILFIILLFINISLCSGLSIWSSFDNLLGNADVICLGEIIQGEVVDGRGAIYTVKIGSILKGSVLEETISVGKYRGLSLGNNYLFLLKNRSENYFEVFFEGMSKFEVIYELINGEFYFCIEISEDLIGVKSFNNKFVNEAVLSKVGLRWNIHRYILQNIVDYIHQFSAPN